MRKRRISVMALLVIAVLHMGFILAEAQTYNVNTTYRLGFLSPSSDSLIPTSLADEWNSAFKVAMEVLNSENRSYNFMASIENTECDWVRAQHATEQLLNPDIMPYLIGAVGPACTDAAMSSGRVFRERNYSHISFAATTPPLSNRVSFPMTFRTVFSDQYQAAAIAASVAKMEIKRLHILIINSYYSLNLGSEINAAVGSLAKTTSYTLVSGENSLINETQLATILETVGKDDLIVMAVHPKYAQEIWKIAYKLDKLKWPFWYFGTDGVTAFDPADVNVTDPKLVNAIQGEIGVSPHGGDILTTSPCAKFYSHWKFKKYPGSPSEGKTRTSPYVPHLIDAVQTYFFIVDNLIKAKVNVTKENVLKALNGSGPGVLEFEGCSGNVSFDPATGSRSRATQAPHFDLVLLTQALWEVKGEIKNGTLLGLQVLTRPGSGPNSSYLGTEGLSSSAKAGIIVGTLLGAVAVLFVAGSALYLYRRKRSGRPFPRSESMRRMMDFVGSSSFRRSDSFEIGDERG